ncbi:carboxymuconolactone decarboxylase [Pseudoclavibacter endophyticus]|uniref:Carboxymuconolactone decarboxylase family protein n=1 Tax=Pseudoclavibacter endophyticus TaxID=1778590 RepID=A0A6H9WKP1_9MICO|nr:carboxymuconolactone decarboxylase family protein [Pseudoclavibacter endophyticus]KAB1648329.1 carboxymuconolactone decarboxylase family protein [Pseudoclavibacter endophyticus]GGA71702.1 carboxymuconolactone decarboxylase [Pseudoclavibacter endophyticus]
MSKRLPRLMPDEMTDEQRDISEKFTGGKRVTPASAFSLVHPDGGLIGPPNAWLLSPPLARIFEQAGGAMRFELTLSDRCREIALLLHAFFRDSAFELYAHRKAGLAAGLSNEEIEALSDRVPPQFESEEERATFDVTVAILDRKTLDDTEYADAVGVLGERALFELVSLVGYYDMIATQLSVFDVQAPDS